MKKTLHALQKHIFVTLFTLASVLGWGQTTIFYENMYNGTGGTSGDAIATHETNNRFNEDGLTYSGTGDMRTTNTSSGYTTVSGASASASWNVLLNANTETFLISGINTSVYSSLSLSFGIRKSTNAENGSSLAVEVSSDGTSWSPLTLPSLPTGTGTATWYYITCSGSIPSTANLRIRFTSSYGTNTFNIDDVELRETLAGKTSTGNGDWNNAATWSPVGVPSNTDNVIIQSGHTVFTSTALTRNAVTNVNGTFQLNAEGWASGTNFTYGTGASLNFNNTSSYGVNSGDVFWPTTNGPTNVNVLQGGLTLNAGANRTVTGIFQTAAGVTLNSATLTLSGTGQINAGGFFNNAPTYTSTSTLVYNGVTGYGVNNEWTGNSTTPGTGIPQNVTLTNSSINMPNANRGLAGNLLISASSTLNLNATSGDLYLAGNWTNSGNFNPNNRAVFFNGNTTQTITKASTETFNYLIVENASSLRLATGTSVVVNGNNGLTLSTTHASSSIDLNGNTFTLSGGGNLSLSSGNRFITSSVTGGVFRITNATVTVTNVGTLTFGTAANPTFATLVLENGFNAGIGAATTLNSVLQINASGFVTGNTLRYNANSLLRYNVGGVYNRNFEWNGSVSPTGVPYNVQLSNNTTLNYVNAANLAQQYITNNLTIDNGSSFYMDYGSTTCGGALNIGNNLVSAGNMSLGFASGDDLRIGGNITFNTGYTFDPKGRAIFFTKAGTQTITASSTPTFHYAVFSTPTTVIQLSGTDLNITAPNTGNVISFNATTNVFDINGRTLTLGTPGLTNAISGNGTFRGSTTSNLTLLGNGSIGTINMDTSTSARQTLGTFTVNRQASTIAAVLGTPLVVNSTLVLTNGIVDLGANMLTLGSTSGAGTLTGGSSSSYVIADRSAAGSFKRFTPTASSYTFPIGDASSSADGTQYSPATVNLTTATLTTASYLQLNVEDTIEPNSQATTDYITRYWNLNGNSITNTTYNFTGTYLPVDIVGTESTSKSGRYATSSGWTEGANLSSNTVSLTGLTTGTGVINNTADSNHYTGGYPFTKAEINIKQGSTSYASGANYAFANVEITTNKDIIFTIENLGLEALNLSAATISGAGFSLLTNYTSPVNGNSTTTFVIRFTPNALSAFSGSISIPNNDISGSENPYIINFTGTGVASSLTDVITAGTEQNTISSTVNNVAITDNTKGVQVWQFTVRDGGATGDNDNLPSILTALNIAKSVSSSIGDFRDAIYSIALFDGSTLLATGNVASATQIQFTGFNVNVPDNTSKTLSVRLSLKCPLGVGALDGDDFVFSISNTNVTFDVAGSGNSAFSAAFSADAKNVIDVVATKLAFTTQPMNTAVNQSMPAVKVSAVDDCGNIDKGFTGTITITSSGSLLTSPLTATLTSGVATFTNIVHTVVETGRTLTATDGTKTIISNNFDITAASDFEKGDFMVVGVNSNIVTCSGTNPAYSAASSYNSGADEISFFSFKNIYNGDVFFITDNGYERTTAGKWADSEGVYKITRTGGTIAAGTVLNMWLYESSPFVTFTSPDNGWTVTKETGFTNPVILNTNGDQIYFMQGGSWSNPAGTHDAVYTPGAILFAFNTNSSWTSLANSTQQSGLYPGMRCFSVLPNAASDFIEYTGPVTAASRRDWIERVNNPNNWTNRLSCSGYTRMHVDQVYTILNGTTVNGLWRGSSDSNWFDCSNWDTLVVPDQNTNVTFNATVANNAVIDYTAADSDLYGDIARVLNLTVDKSLTIEASPNNKLEVYGNLTLNAGGTLDMDDSNATTQDGQIYLYGNWTNNAGEANFLQGQSTVHFLGTSPQIINANNHTSVEKFGNVVLGNDFDTAVSNDLFMDGNFTLNTSKNLTINTNGNFVEVGGNFINNGNVTVENDGNLIQRGDTYTGNNITVKRNAQLKRLDYNYWGSPVANQNLKSFSLGTLNSRFYTYNETDDLFTSIDPLANSFQRAKGYAIRASNYAPATPAIFNGIFIGQPHNGTFTTPVAYSSAASQGNNLVSNPYPSNIDFDLLYTDNSSLIYKTAYFWTNVNPNPEMQGNQYPKTGSINNYAVYSGTGGLAAPYGFDLSRPATSTPNNIIKVGQGFIVKAKTVPGGNLEFKNTIRVKDNSGNFFNRMSSNNSKDRFWLELKTPLNFVSPILIGYVKGATDQFELDFDAPLLVEGADSFYSILGNEKLAIQGKKTPIKQTDVIPLGAHFYETGKHTISIANKDGEFANGKPIYLHDKVEEVYTNLQNESYTFSAQNGESNNRFEIVYQMPNSTLTNLENSKYGLMIYQSADNYIIEANKSFDKVNIFDVSGRLIHTIKAGKKQLIIEKSKLSQKICIFSIIFANEIIYKKILSN